MTEPFGRSTLLRRLDAHVRERPSKPFVLLYRGERFGVLTFADLATEAETWAARFQAAAPQPGAVVFLVLRHGMDAYAAFLGAMRAGLTPAFLPPPSPKQDPALFWNAKRALFARTRPAAAVVGEADAGALAQASEPVACPLIVAEAPARLGNVAALCDPAPEAPALLQHSSGTTGLKKAVRLSFSQVDRHAGMVAAPLGFGPDDVVASWLPLYHDMGLMAAFLIPLTLGASVVALDPFAWTADPASLLRAVERHRATLCWMPNFAFAHLVRTRDPAARHDLSSLRALIDCSEPCRPETVDAFCAAFAADGITPEKIACSYGMAEAVFACTQTLPGQAPRRLTVDAARLERADEIAKAWPGGRAHSFLSCGPPLPGVDLRIAPRPGAATPTRGVPVGEIEVASAVLFDGYHHGGDAPVDPPRDGWRKTGDVGFLHEGELFVCGRTLERLIVHGRTVFAGDVEAAVSEVPGVKPGRAVALGVHDEAAGGEEAYVMLEADGPLPDPADRETLARAVRRAVADRLDLALKGVEIGPPGWLAKSTSGKMSRADNLVKLQRLLAQGAPVAAPAPGPRPQPAPRPGVSVRGAVAQALAEGFGPDGAALGDDRGLGDVAGWDSLGHAILILRVEALLGVKAADADMAAARTVGGLVRAFEAVVQANARRAA
jgi:acyl-CoA synthetase (AMP-forming)/AMP-acid ligase II/acyl carrier protein